MPVRRYYICDSCDHRFDIKQEFNEDTLKQCPECKQNELYQDLSGQYSFIIGEPTTVGQLADRNTKKMGRYELEDRMKADGIPERIEKRKKVEKVRKINSMTPEQKTRYIYEGE